MILRLSDRPSDGGDYLWDKSGTPDPLIAELETVLGGLALRAAPPVVMRSQTASVQPRITAPDRRATDARSLRASARPRLLAAAAMIVLGVAVALLVPARPSPWTIEPLDGATTVGSSALRRPGELRPRQWVRTDAGSRAQITVEGLGEVRVDPDTRVRILSGPSNRRLLDLARGSIHAFVSAPPRMFQVNTPSARAVDLGCEYTLKVDPSGAGELRVLLGYVQLQWGGRSVTIPMDGGMCLTRPGFGPGTPFFSDAAPRLIDELRRFDFESAGEPALNAVLSEARPRDALSLWHLIQRAEPELRGSVYDRLSQLKPPPAGVMRSGVLALDRAMLDAWWDQMRPF